MVLVSITVIESCHASSFAFSGSIESSLSDSGSGDSGSIRLRSLMASHSYLSLMSVRSFSEEMRYISRSITS